MSHDLADVLPSNAVAEAQQEVSPAPAAVMLAAKRTFKGLAVAVQADKKEIIELKKTNRELEKMLKELNITLGFNYDSDSIGSSGFLKNPNRLAPK